jgi:hypothetical protein
MFTQNFVNGDQILIITTSTAFEKPGFQTGAGSEKLRIHQTILDG